MSEDVVLYDMREKDHPNKRGDVFRTLQVFKCWVCYALTNKVKVTAGGYPGYVYVMTCPNSSECWHHELERKIRWLRNPHPKSYKEELREEIDTERKENALFVINDLEGPYDKKLEGSTNNVCSFKVNDPKCRHFIQDLLR